MQLRAVAPHPDRSIDHDEVRALVGWTHTDVPMGIHLRIESARSMIALENGRIESQHLVMTRNQAMLLARYLLRATQQPMPERRPVPLRARLMRWFRR